MVFQIEPKIVFQTNGSFGVTIIFSFLLYTIYLSISASLLIDWFVQSPGEMMPHHFAHSYLPASYGADQQNIFRFDSLPIPGGLAAFRKFKHFIINNQNLS